MSTAFRSIAPYGEWDSPITAGDVARGHTRLSFPLIDDSGVWWQETRTTEGGRQAVVRARVDGVAVAVAVAGDAVPASWNVRTRVHEYGGRSYQPVPGGMVFASFADQRLYLVLGRDGQDGQDGRDGAEPVPLTPDNDDRYADFIVSPGGDALWCVREREDYAGINRAIVAVPLDGSAADRADAVRVLVSGSDFLAYPTPSPDGTMLAWVCWDHPRMPWDGTELRVAPIDDLTHYQVLMGGETESVLAPVWRDHRSLYAVSDRSGWWNLYLTDLAGQVRALCPREEEFAGPLWQLGGRPFGVRSDGQLVVVHGTDVTSLAVLDPGTGELTDVDTPWLVFVPQVSVSGDVVAGLAGGPTMPMSVVTVNTATGAARELRREADAQPDAAYLPEPRAERLTGQDGEVVHAFVYPPASGDFAAPDGELPPFVIWVHGGPTSRVYPMFDLEKAYFTSRGIGVIDVNYGGSSGYGRAYRERLHGQWGVVDVQDVIFAARALADTGQADGKRLGIRGGSAGGWTALAAVTTGLGLGADAEPGSGAGSGAEAGSARRFAAAVSYFGVSDLRSFAALTHDFESRYLDGLIGPLPEAEELYRRRAPVGHVTDSTSPVLLLQGLDDPVVPPVQSESIASDLAAHGIPHAFLAFDGESHGFRKSQTIVACLEAELTFYGQVMGFTPPGVNPIALA